MRLLWCSEILSECKCDVYGFNLFFEEIIIFSLPSSGRLDSKFGNGILTLGPFTLKMYSPAK